MSRPPLPRELGAYVLTERLAEGGMGTVYLAKAKAQGGGLEAGRLVVKCLSSELADDEGYVRRFRHEARVSVSIRSPNVAAVYELGRAKDLLYIVMEHVDGLDLSRLFARRAELHLPLPVPALLGLARGLLSGLADLHRATDPETSGSLHLVHRDVSPKNVMVSRAGVPKIIDLGLGKSAAQDWRTRTGRHMGGLGYMAPEQLDAGVEVDQRADLYAAAVVLFEAATLTPYVPRGDAMSMIEAQTHPRRRRPSELRPEVPPAFDDAVFRGLELDRARRFPTADAFLAALPPPTEDEATALSAAVAECAGPSGRRPTSAAKARPRDEAGEPTVVFSTRPAAARGDPTEVLTVPPGDPSGPTGPSPVFAEVKTDEWTAPTMATRTRARPDPEPTASIPAVDVGAAPVSTSFVPTLSGELSLAAASARTEAVRTPSGAPRIVPVRPLADESTLPLSLPGVEPEIPRASSGRGAPAAARSAPPSLAPPPTPLAALSPPGGLRIGTGALVLLTLAAALAVASVFLAAPEQVIRIPSAPAVGLDDLRERASALQASRPGPAVDRLVERLSQSERPEDLARIDAELRALEAARE